MSKLSDDIRAFIVKELACFETPSAIALVVKERFGVEIDRRQVYGYDPDAARPPAARWLELHAATRKRFLEEVGSIPIANKSYRLQQLDRLTRNAIDRGNAKLAAELMEQAAKECGDAYSNKVRLTGADGGPVRHEVVTSEQAERDLDEIFGESTAPAAPPRQH
ncbi:DUF2280 domain-containing protein [Dongia sedimenti]|uniref:DUF2280 domain-containing protein n=1 Tax=Dongia sedimenti TaxID=3064282 RepID=A0ABU0YVK1_9PROT|nr:DUF2280 domain-containing protein [Rhodospirillaceae bacterium R-7]